MPTATDSKLQEGEPPTPADAPTDAVISADTRRDNRIPPSQSRTKKWPVLDTGVHPPPLRPEDVTLEIYGQVAAPVTLTWSDLQALPHTRVFADMHCVTRWSRLGNVWEGVLARDVLKAADVKPDARFVSVWGRDVVTYFRGGSATWSTNLPLERLVADDVLLAWSHDGEPLTNEHGGPVRLVVPTLYAWKSAKWVRAFELRATDEAGYWERGGYHMLGDPWREQRFRFSNDGTEI